MVLADGLTPAAGDSQPDEWARIAALRKLGILDAAPEPDLDRLVHLIAQLLEVPIAMISLVDEHRQWFVSRVGLDARETPRDIAFCDHTIRGDAVTIVGDALEDDRFRENPLVTGEPHIRFYAGAPLLLGDGNAIGSLCVIDRRPRSLTPMQTALLAEFASFVVHHLEERARLVETDATRGYLESLLDASPFAIVSFDREMRVVNWNRAAETLFGYASADVIGNIPPSIPGVELDSFRAAMETVFAGQHFAERLTDRVARDGTALKISISAGPVRRADGAIVGAMCIARDVTEASRREEIDRRRYEILELAANGAELDVVLSRSVACLEFALPDATGAVMLLEGGTLRIAATGASMHPELRAGSDRIPVGPDEGSCGTAAFLGAPVFIADVRADERWRKYRGLAERVGVISCWSAPIPSAQGVLGTVAAYFSSFSEATETQRRFLSEMANLVAIAIESDRSRISLEMAALRDPLTHLANRTAFDERLRIAISHARETGTKVALGLVDLDRFKDVNDTHGHEIGDLLLREVAHRLTSAARAGDTVARVGGDEFVFCLTGLSDRTSLERAVARFQAALDPAFTPGGNNVDTAASIGVALFPDDASEPSQLYRLADRAMYVAKTGNAGVTFHGIEAPDALRASEIMVRDLGAALERGELCLHFQPKVSLVDGEVSGVEALLRWQHPVRGLLGPGEFMSAAEESGLSIPIGAWVIAEAARAVRRFAEAGRAFSVCANVSPRQFEDADFVPSVARAIALAGVPAGRLYLEITETLIMRSPLATARTLRAIAELGARTLIDDYGTGYSSLSYLRGIVVAGIKIHPTFVHDIDAPDRADAARAMAGAIATFGRTLGIEVIAEGVETEVQARTLAAAGCAVGQGYLFAPPLPFDEAVRWGSVRGRAQPV